MKSKINHFLPMFCLVEKINNNTRMKFKWILKKDTESLELVGLSYYKVIIKPLLKLLERNKSIGISKTKGNVLQKWNPKRLQILVEIESNTIIIYK